MQSLYIGSSSFRYRHYPHSGDARGRHRRDLYSYDPDVHRLLNEFLHGYPLHDNHDVRYRSIFQYRRDVHLN